MKKIFLLTFYKLAICSAAFAQSFSAGNLVVLQTAGTASKASSQVTLKEFTTTGVAGLSVVIPATGATPFQSAGIYGGSEGFLTTSTDGKFLVLGGYKTSGNFADITGTTASSVPRVMGIVYPSGYYLEIDTSANFYSANDIRGGISDGVNFWASGASNNNIDGINYFGPGPKAGLGTASTPPKAYGLRIFNGQIYYSTQKSGPNNSSSQLGIFTLGTGTPTSGTPTTAIMINTGGSNFTEDFSIDPTGTICYIAINLNTANGGIQKWTKTGTVWSLAYTLGTGIANTGAYGLVADYTGAQPVIYATTFDAGGNRVIKITDNGSSSPATTIVPATSGVYYKGISFAPAATGTPLVNLAVSTDTASEAGATVVTISANASAPVAGNQTLSLAISGAGITAGDYTLTNTIITIPNGATTGSVTFTIVDDVLGEGTETAIITATNLSAGITAGLKTVQNITINDNDGNNHPFVTMMVDSTTNYIDGGVTNALLSPFKASGVISDPTDPLATLGIFFKTTDLETDAASLTVSLKSSNTTVVPLGNLTLSGTDSIRKLLITPAATGYSNITVTVKDGLDSTSYIINYAASAASATPANTIWHTGISDGSDAVAIDDTYYICGDDELNVLNVYSRSESGLPFYSYNYTSYLNLPEPLSPEVDIEASARSLTNSNMVFWLGSMSNGKAPFNAKPNRDRLFATAVSGTGAATSFAFSGYTAIKTSLLSWGDANGYGFTASAAAGVDSKSPGGFAAEGMVFGPDSTTLYIALRAPLVPVTNRNKALIAPIQNFEAWFNNGNTVGNPTYAAPIELDLGGRGIRDIIRLSNGIYIIVAGSVGSSVSGALYKWTGKATDAPIAINSPSTNNLNMEGAMPVNTGNVSSFNSLQVLSDFGDEILYNDGTVAKDFNDLIYRKYRLDNISPIDLTMPPLYTNVQGDTSAYTTPNGCDTVITYDVTASGIPEPTLTYVFSGATTGSGNGTGSGSVFNRGVTQVTITATNTFNTADTTFTITITDNQPPTITAPADITVSSDAGMCFATNVALGTPATSDNCVTAVVNDAPATFNVGITAVLWTVTDDEGNTDTATQWVTVEASGENWTGAADSLWSNAANWSCNTIPTFATDVVIPASATNMPVVDITGAACNNLTIDNGASLHFTGSVNILEAKGDITANGSFDAGAGKVILSGNNSQQLAAATYAELTVDGGFNKTLQGNTTITGALNLSDGYLVLNNNELVIENPSMISGAGASSFIVTNDTGVVTGRNIDNGTGSILFPVGSSAADYTPLTFSNAGTPDDFSIRVMTNVYEHYNGHVPNGLLQTQNAVNKTWFISEATTGGSNATITPHWNQGNELPQFDRNLSCVSHYDNGINSWQPGVLSPAAGTGPYSRSMTVTSFSPFGVGSTSSPLDIKLLSFSGIYVSPGTILNWTAVNERNILSYSIERSADNKNYYEIGSVTAGDKKKTGYAFTDGEAMAQKLNNLYYRLRMNNEDGSSSYSHIVNIYITDKAGFDVIVTPNPVAGSDLTILVTGKPDQGIDLEISDIMGRTLKRLHYANAKNSNTIVIDVADLSSGLYTLRVKSNNTNLKNLKFSKH